MEVEGVAEGRPVKSRKPAAAAPAAVNHSSPTTYFLKTEKEMERSVQRGRKPSRSAITLETGISRLEPGTSMTSSSFGVQSLEDTINTAFSSDSDISRASSTNPEHSPGASRDGEAPIGRKKRAGNPVHPKIKSAGHRIISSERPPKTSSATASPMSARSSESPFRLHSLRRTSTSSPSPSQPCTPVKMSPHPQFATPSTPRSTSAKSFRLSDEEASVADEIQSQAVVSSAGEGEHNEVERTPQLVMPSLAMPARRPFTEHGKSMGRLKLMVMGPKGVGKTSFIQSILRSTEHIVHVDSVATRSSAEQGVEAQTLTSFVEHSASTKPLPSWWSELGSKNARSRRLSMGDVLERNLTFVESIPDDDDAQAQRINDYLSESLRRTMSIDSLSDSEIIGMLSGDGGVQIDAVIYMFDPSTHEVSDTLSTAVQNLLRSVSRWTNLIPILSHADQVTPDVLATRREQIVKTLADLGIETYKLGSGVDEPFAISSASVNDHDVIDASLLMSSQYMTPLVPSELDQLVDKLFSHVHMARLRRLSATKFLTWRRENMADLFPLEKRNYLPISPSGFQSPGVTSTGSLLGDPSKVLVPYGSSSYYRSASPSISEASGLPASEYALAPYREQHDAQAPIREVITAKWAQDLTRSREKETRRYAQMYHQPPSEWDPEGQPEKDRPLGLIPVREPQRPARGRLGGDLGVIDPRDPLGIVAFTQAFSRRGYFALQVAGGCGLLGAVCYCVVRYWANVQEMCGLGQTSSVIHAAAIPAPSRSSLSAWEAQLRAFFGWER